MTTQAQGKGKKKNKEITKLSLDEFNQVDAPHGHSIVSLKMAGLDWAATMADYEQNSVETQQIIVPAAPRAQRGPGIDFESLPIEGPFRLSLFGLPLTAEEKDIRERILIGINVVRVDVDKQSTTVEVASREDLYEALCKDGQNFKGKLINICIFGQVPKNDQSDRGYGRGSYGDRYGDRDQGRSYGGGFGGSRTGDRPYMNNNNEDRPRMSGFGNRDRDRDNYGSFTRASGGGGSGFGQSRGGYGEAFQDRNNFRDNRGSYTSGGGEPVSEEPENWRSRPTVKPPSPQVHAFNNGSRQPYSHSRPEPSRFQQAPPQQYQSESYNHSRYQSHHDHPTNTPQSGLASRSLSSASTEERPKLVLQKRTTPLNIDDVSNVKRNEAIFGKAKPNSTPYEKMKEVEQKLKSVHLSDRKDSPQASSQAGSQAGSQPGSAPRSRQISERSSRD